MSGRRLTERRLGLLLAAPAILAMLLVTAWPILDALWLSLFRDDLRFPAERAFVGFANYASVLTSEVWWGALANTLLITAGSVLIELPLGFALALLMHHTLVGRAAVRTAVLVPYAIITVVAALAWRFAFDPVTGFVDAIPGLGGPWLTERASAFAVIIAAEVWKTTPFVALLLLAGLTLIPPDLARAARVDGATAWQRWRYITLPLMRPAILVALLFRTLDAFRVFDTVFVLTRGGQETEVVSLVAWQVLVGRLNLGLGAAVAVLIFLITAGLAGLWLLAFRGVLPARRGGPGGRRERRRDSVRGAAVLAPRRPRRDGLCPAAGRLAPVALTQARRRPGRRTLHPPPAEPRALSGRVPGPAVSAGPAELRGRRAHRHPDRGDHCDPGRLCHRAAALPGAPAAARGRARGGHVPAHRHRGSAVRPVAPVRALRYLAGLVIPYVTLTLPLAIWTIAAFFRELPWELEQAARVDGATRLQAFRYAILPLAAPGVFAAAILVFIFAWNDFLFAACLTSTTASRTVPAAIAFFTGSSRFAQPTGTIAAAAVLVTIPVVLLILSFQRRIIAGLTGGAVKG